MLSLKWVGGDLDGKLKKSNTSIVNPKQTYVAITSMSPRARHKEKMTSNLELSAPPTLVHSAIAHTKAIRRDSWLSVVSTACEAGSFLKCR